MSDRKITIHQDGPLKVEGDVRLVDHDENEVPTKEGLPYFLCRCGHSQKKPFCDGSHKRMDFDGS